MGKGWRVDQRQQQMGRITTEARHRDYYERNNIIALLSLLLMVAARAFTATAAARSTIIILQCPLPPLSLPLLAHSPVGRIAAAGASAPLLPPHLVVWRAERTLHVFALWEWFHTDSPPPSAINCHCTEFNSPHFMAAPEASPGWPCVLLLP